MKIHHLIPTLISGGIAISAVFLFLHTASSRHSAAKSLRLAAEESARESSPHDRESAASTPANSLRQSLTATERRSVMGKRLDGVRSVGNSVDQTRALLTLIREFDSGDFKLAMEACKPGPDEPPGNEYETILEEWSRRDPLAALAYAGSDAGIKARVLSTWSQADPEAALNWARQDAGDDPGTGLLGSVIAAIAKWNPKLAMDHLVELPEEARQSTIETIVNSGEKDSAKAVVEWIGEIKDPGERAETAKEIYENWNTFDTLEQKYALFEAYPETLSGQPIENLFRCWNFYDLPAVRAAIDRLPPGDLRNEAMQGALSGLSMIGNNQGAKEMLAAYRDEIDDEMLGKLLVETRGEDPVSTLQQAGLIQDAAIRDRAVADVLAIWADSEPAAVREWMAGHEVSPLAREKFENLLKLQNDPSDMRLLDALSR